MGAAVYTMEYTTGGIYQYIPVYTDPVIRYTRTATARDGPWAARGATTCTHAVHGRAARAPGPDAS